MSQFNYKGKRWERVRAAALRRDKYQCQWCKRYGRNRQATTVHHIKHTEDYPELVYNLDNLVSLCSSCHNKAHPEKSKAARSVKF